MSPCVIKEIGVARVSIFNIPCCMSLSPRKGRVAVSDLRTKGPRNTFSDRNAGTLAEVALLWE